MLRFSRINIDTGQRTKLHVLTFCLMECGQSDKPSFTDLGHSIPL